MSLTAPTASPAPIAAAPAIMSIHDISVYSPTGRQLVFDMSVDVSDRSVTSIIGQSGTGKSVFVSTIGGLPPEGCLVRGHVFYLGVDIYSLAAMRSGEWRREIMVVPQYPTVLPSAIYDNIAMPLNYWRRRSPALRHIRNRADVDAAVENALTRAGLWTEVKDRLREAASALSAGQKQRLCISRALALLPRVLIFDEPSAHLDPLAATKLEELIDELRAELAMIVVTHSMAEAARISQKTAFLRLGRIIETGPTEEIFTKPRDASTQDYVTGRIG